MALPSCRCVGAYPNWKLLGPIVAAARTWAGESPDLHCFDNRPIIDQLRGLYCATLTVSGGGGGGGATLLASFYIPEIVDSFERGIAAGFTGDGDSDPFQREDAVDVLRDDHYQSGIDGQLIILEDDPTACVLVAPENIIGVGGESEFDASWDDIPITVSLLRYEWRLDDTGSWTSNGTSTVLSGESAPAGDHVLNVRAVSTSGVPGITGDSAEFTVDPPPEPTWTDTIPGASTDTDDAFGDQATRQPIVCGTTGMCTHIRVWIRTENAPFGIKVALYDSSRNLLGQGAATGVTVGSGAWATVALDTPVAVTASTTYGIGFAFNNTSWGIPGYLAGSPADSSFIDFGTAYAGFPTDPFTSGGGVTFLFAAGMGVI